MSRRWHGARRTSEPDRWLEERGLYRKHMPRDSTCLFRAISENIYKTQRYYQSVRAECVNFVATNPHLFEGSLSCTIETYVMEMSNASEYGGFRELRAMSHVYRRDFVVLEMNKSLQTKISNDYGRDIYLFYIPETKHFDAVYTKEHIANSAFSQSIMYELLFDGVFQMKDLFYAVDKMLHDKVPTDHIEYFMSENVERRRKMREQSKGGPLTAEVIIKKSKPFPKCKHQTEDFEYDEKYETILVVNKSLNRYEDVCLSCLDVDSARDLLRHGITPFPYKVAKALDPSIYRNIEFDVWTETRKELRYGLRYADGTTLQVGVKCLCRLEPEQKVPYYCHIQEMRPDAGTTVVFVEEIGVKTQLRLDQLEPLPKEEARPWAPPYRHSRSNSHFWNVGLMLQQIGNIARKHTSKRKVKSCEDEKRVEVRRAKIDVKEEPLEYAEECVADVCQMSVMMCAQCSFARAVDLSAYSQLDYYTFQPYPVEITALPLMVDCRPVSGAGAAAADSAPPPAAAPGDNQPPPAPQQGPGNDAAPLPQPPPATATRASTPAAAPPLNTYSGGMVGGGGYAPVPPYAMYGGGGGGGGAGGVKGGVMLCAAPSYPGMPHIPSNINTNVTRSVQLNGSDLPMNDIATLRYFFNLGLEYLWGTYPPQQMMAPPMAPPPLAHPPPRFYSPVNDIAQDMQQGLCLHERPAPPNHNGENKGSGGKQQGGGGGGASGGGGGPAGQDKPQASGQGNKGNGQRPLLGPRFKRGNGEGNYGNHNHGGYQKNNNFHNNKGGMNSNRRYTHGDMRGQAGAVPVYGAGAEAECGAVEPAMYSVPYVQYPPPVYHYYQVDPTEPGMMMGGVGFMGYVGEDLGELPYPAPAPLVPTYYQPQYQPPPPHHAPPHHDHK